MPIDHLEAHVTGRLSSTVMFTVLALVVLVFYFIISLVAALARPPGSSVPHYVAL